MGDFASWLQVLHSTGRTSSTLAAMNQIALKLLGLFSAQGLFTFLDIHFVTILGERLSTGLKTDLFSSILAQDMSFFDSRMHGEIASRLSSDLSDFKHTVKICITQGLKAMTQIIGTCAHLIYLSPSLSGTLLCIMPGIYFGMNAYGSYLRKISKLAKESESQANGVAGEVCPLSLLIICTTF
jgi:ATP-binding cassette subfamily B (MDR/TAP) protein 8